METNVTSPIGNKTLPMSSYSVGGGIGLGRGIGMKDNNAFGNNLDSMYNSFNNNSINSPKVYSGRNASFPAMGNHYEPVGYPGMNRLSNTMNNPQMMGIPGSQPWMPYNDPSMLGMKGWNDMMGFNDIYNNQFYNYDVMNPDLNKSNFNQHFYYQQLMQQSQQFPPQYYQMMRQMPQNQMPMFNVFGQPINTVGMKPMVSNPNTLGTMQNEIIPPMNTTTTTTTNNTQTLFANNDTNQNISQNTTNMWNTTPQNTINNNININTNKADNNKTDSIPNVDNTNTNKPDESTTTQPINNETENNENTQKEDIANDIPINEANTDKDEAVEEINNEEPEQNEEPETETTNEEVQENNNNEEDLVEEDNDEEENEKKEEDIEVEEEVNVEEVEEESEPSKEDKEESPVEEIPDKKEEEVVKEEVKKPIAPAPVKNHWKVSTNKTQRLSIKEIQEMEEKEKLEQLKKQQQEMKEKREAAAAAEAASAEASPVTHSEPTTVWGAPHNNIQKPTLRQIMQEEENNKKKQKDLQMKEAESKKASKQNTHVVVNTTRSVWAGRPLTIIADSNSQVVSASSLNAAKKEPVKKEIISTAAPVRPQQSQVSTSASNTPTTSRSDNEWTPVGKTVKKSEPVHKITKSSSKSDNSKKGPSDAFMKWCKNALRVSTSAGVNVDEFVNVLLLMPLNETSVIYDICTDTLGGITAIDPLKFAEEFIKRRKMDQNDQSFSAVRGYSSYSHDESKNSNKFIPVKGSGRKKNRQNLN